MPVGTEQLASRRTGRFALFTECLLTGLWLTLAAVPLVTVPAAFAAACAHLDRFLTGYPCGWRDFAADLRAGVRRSWWVALAGMGGIAVLVADVLIARAGAPGAPLIIAVSVALAVAMLVIGMRAAAAWTPRADWRELLATAARQARVDFRGNVILVGGLVVVAAVTWQLLPLFVPVVGCLAGAALAVHRRYQQLEQ
jgi:hypothetical protein